MTEASHNPRSILVTGGAGFIGCNLVRSLLAADASARVVVYDALTYAGSQWNLAGLAERCAGRYAFVQGDIRDGAAVAGVLASEGIDTVIHLAAQTHVDRSITDAAEFLQTNVIGTFVLLEAARRAWAGRSDVRFHHVSTDEIYGSLGPAGQFRETTPYDPSSPYSASKAGADHLVRAWYRTYGLPVTISNCSNNYGPFQFPEKLIPLMIASALAGRPLPVYGDGRNVRDWLHVADHCRAIELVVRRGEPGRTYNVGGGNEWANIDLVHLLCGVLDELRPRGAGSYRDLVTFVPDRPGHDRRYAICADRLREELGWRPEFDFAAGLRQTVQWYLENERWLEQIRQEKYQGQRLGLA